MTKKWAGRLGLLQCHCPFLFFPFFVCSRGPESHSSSLFCSSQALIPLVVPFPNWGTSFREYFITLEPGLLFYLLKGQGTAPKSQQFQNSTLYIPKTVLTAHSCLDPPQVFLGEDPGSLWCLRLLLLFLQFDITCFLSSKNFTFWGVCLFTNNASVILFVIVILLKIMFFCYFNAEGKCMCFICKMHVLHLPSGT